jgi:hypothetical protein
VCCGYINTVTSNTYTLQHTWSTSKKLILCKYTRHTHTHTHTLAYLVDVHEVNDLALFLSDRDESSCALGALHLGVVLNVCVCVFVYAVVDSACIYEHTSLHILAHTLHYILAHTLHYTIPTTHTCTSHTPSYRRQHALPLGSNVLTVVLVVLATGGLAE